jgi:hypothetical protein
MPDEKIINRTIDLFEDIFPADNKYIILLWDNSNKGKYVDRNKNIYFENVKNKKFWQIVGDVNKYESIVVHYLSTQSASFLNKIVHPRVYWIEWGGDLYETFLEYKGFKLFTDEKMISKVIYGNIPYFLYKFGKKLKRMNQMKLLSSAVTKVRYFVPDSMFDEYPLFLSYYPEFSHLEYREFFYYPIDEILGKDLINKTCSENSIIIGNSCSFTGNHIDVFSKLKDLNINNKIIVPLSYSGNSRYKNKVINYGNSIFGERFNPITQYLPLNEYNNLLLKASIYIYGNLRQEAVGNILIALFLGGKVFLYNNNPLLKFYKNLGLIIFNMDELSIESINTKLTKTQIQTNRNILLEQYSLSRLKTLIRNNF